VEYPVELDLNPEIVSVIIDKTTELYEQDDVTALENEPEINGDNLDDLITESFGTNPYYEELKGMIEDLEPDQQMSLVALMWVGRGDYSLEEWDEALEHAEESWNDHTADYLIGTPMLADYLSEALELVGDQ